MKSLIVLTAAVLSFVATPVCHAKASHPSVRRVSHLKCYKVGSLIQVGSQVQCSVPVVNKHQAIEVCFDHDAMVYDPKTPNFKRASYEVWLSRGGFHTIAREAFRSRVDNKDGDDKLTYIYSHAKRFSDFNEAAENNLKVELSKVLLDSKLVTQGQLRFQNQLYCF